MTAAAEEQPKGRPAGAAGDTRVAWSPKDNTLLFLGNICGGMDIFTVNADGSELHSYTRAEDIDIMPQWAPAGDRAAFVTYAGQRAVLRVVTIPGGGVREVASASQRSMGDLAWSPDGRYLAFSVSGGTGFCEGAQPETTEVEVLG